MILPGEDRGHINLDEFDEKRYIDLRAQLHEHTKKFLTTKAEAQRLLDIIKILQDD